MHKAIVLLKKIPKGRVATYKEMARVCNTSPRAIGSIMASNKHPVEFPCYKVVSSRGDLCGYSGPGGLKTKKKLLEKDGIKLVHSKVPISYFWRFK
ncbi:MAG: MGMT family protein [bacterium]|nr:MGMT family protein [bacterium]